MNLREIVVEELKYQKLQKELLIDTIELVDLSIEILEKIINEDINKFSEEQLHKLLGVYLESIK